MCCGDGAGRGEKRARKRGGGKGRKGIDLGQPYAEFINDVGLYVEHIHSMPEMLHL
jgi:hypothetical protein